MARSAVRSIGSPKRQTVAGPFDRHRVPSRPGLGTRTLRSTIASIALAVLVACGSEQAVTFTSAEPPEPASVRLFIGRSEVTQHVPLNSGFTDVLEVRLFAASGARITGYDGHFVLALEFLPATLVAVAPVRDEPLLRALTPAAPVHEAGTFRVSLYHEHTMTARTFGPFDVLIH